MTWLPMPWLITSPGLLQKWCWLYTLKYELFREIWSNDMAADALAHCVARSVDYLGLTGTYLDEEF